MKDLAGHPLEVAQELAKLDRQTQFKVLETVLGDHSVCKSFMGATGRLPAPVESTEPDPKTGPERAGIRYVVGAARAAVLKAIPQPLIDTEIFPAGRTVVKAQLFVDSKKFADGTPKGRADTNMTQSGQLGYPLEFDLRWLELHLTSDDPAMPALLLPHLSLTFFFGCNTPWLRVPVSAMRPMLGLPDSNLKPADYEKLGRSIRRQLEERKWCWGHYWTPCGDIIVRRIESTESFRAEIDCEKPIALTSPVRVQVAMQDTLYASL
jgi:hypothetical protein